MFRHAIAFVACVGLLISGVSAAGFSAQLVQSSGAAPLQNGANSVNIGSGTWTTTALAGFNDGQFQTDGGYIIPVGGVYHFDAVIQVEVTATSPPNQQADLRIVRCANGCNALCNGGTDVAETLIQSGNIYLSDSFNGAFPPTFSLSASFTGLFNTGDLIALCVDNEATSGSVKIVCPANTCAFSGFAA